jgi:hypothetical protein
MVEEFNRGLFQQSLFEGKPHLDSENGTLRKKAFYLVIIVAFLLSSISVVRAEPVVESGPITIGVDGSVDPPTAPVQRVGDYYTLTADLIASADGIIIEASNIVFDGDGHLIRGNNTGTGIFLFLDLVNETILSNVTVKNCEITHFDNGVFLNGADDTTGGMRGYNIAISFNKMAGNNRDLHLDDASDSAISENSLGSTISLDSTYLQYSDVYGNSMGGLTFWYSGDNIIHGNNITQIDVTYSGGNAWYENNISSNGGCGVGLNAACETFYKNNIRDNLVGVGIGFHSQNTYFYNNNFINNTEQVHFGDEVGPVGWNGNYTIGGNYWDSYVGADIKSGPYQNLTGSDGIGDTAYFLGLSYPEAGPLYSYSDNYPLMQPIDWTDPVPIPEFPSTQILVLLLLLSAFTLFLFKTQRKDPTRPRRFEGT